MDSIVAAFASFCLRRSSFRTPRDPSSRCNANADKPEQHLVSTLPPHRTALSEHAATPQSAAGRMREQSTTAGWGLQEKAVKPSHKLGCFTGGGCGQFVKPTGHPGK